MQKRVDFSSFFLPSSTLLTFSLSLLLLLPSLPPSFLIVRNCFTGVRLIVHSPPPLREEGGVLVPRFSTTCIHATLIKTDTFSAWETNFCRISAILFGVGVENSWKGGRVITNDFKGRCTPSWTSGSKPFSAFPSFLYFPLLTSSCCFNVVHSGWRTGWMKLCVAGSNLACC